MQTLVNILRVMLSVFPAAVDLVLAIERAAPIKGIGPDKLQLLENLVSDAYAVLEEDAKKGLSLEAVAKAVVVLANRLVAFFNKVGWPLTT
jgi:hypothetical protein